MIRLSKDEAKLQKKGIENMNLDELKLWIQTCKRNELTVEHNKARRNWKDIRLKAEERIYNMK